MVIKNLVAQTIYVRKTYKNLIQEPGHIIKIFNMWFFFLPFVIFSLSLQACTQSFPDNVLRRTKSKIKNDGHTKVRVEYNLS